MSPLLSAPIAPTLARLAAPGIVLALFQTAVSIGDTYFVGQLGTESLAGLALVFPMLMLLQMTSAGAMGGGVSSAVARLLRGSGNTLAPALAFASTATVQVPLSGALTLGWGPFPRLGIAGAATSYVVAFGLASLVMAVLVWRSALRPQRAHLRLEGKLFREILRVSAISSVSALQTVLTAVILTGF